MLRSPPSSAEPAVCPLFLLVLVGCTATSSGRCTGRTQAAGPPPEAPALSDAPLPGARYELGPLPVTGDALRWPAQPAIRHEEIAGAPAGRLVVRQSGTRVVVRAALDELVVAADDVEVRGEAGARIGHLAIERGRRRVRIDGGRYGFIELPVPASFDSRPPVWDPDWMVEDVTIEGVEVEAARSAFFVRGRRVAILRSRARAEHYSVWCGDTGEAQTEDLVLAGNRFESAGPESTVRLVNVRRAVVVDNVLSNTLKHDFRVHGASDTVVFARNRLIRTGIMIGTMDGDHVGAVWILDNELHHDVPSLFQASPERVRSLTVHGNRVFSDRWDCFVCELVERWSVGDNPIAPYEPAPASWSEWPAREQRSPPPARSGEAESRPGAAPLRAAE